MNSRPRIRGISLPEMLLTVAIVGVVMFVGAGYLSKTYEGAKVTKLESDVASINRAVKVYVANGGSLEGVSDPQRILDKLKTSRTDASSGTFAGLRGSMIDLRLRAQMQTEAEAASEGKRALWSAAENRFEIVSSGQGGVARFVLDDALANIDYGAEERANSPLDLNANDGWIWAYEDAPSARPPGPTVIPVSGGGSTGGSTGASDGSDPGLATLSPPTISPGGGSFQYSEFPLTVTISNPNPQLSSWIMVSTGGAFANYSGPFSVSPGMTVSSYVTGDSALWNDSSTVSGTFLRDDYQLQPPTIAASPSSEFDGSTQEITVTLTDPNPAGLAKIVYWLSSNSTPVDYSGPITLFASNHPDGVTVFGQAIALESFAVDSAEAQLPIVNSEPAKLDPPEIALSETTFDENTSLIDVTLTNPNPPGSSQIFYALKDPAGGYPPVSAYLPYLVQFPVSVADFPEGFHIRAYAKSLDPATYEDSDFVEAVTNAEFFDVTLTGDVLFILDASGSMNASHGSSKRFEVVVAETIEAINQLSESQKFSVVLFSHYIRWTDGSGELKPATPENKAAMISALSTQSAVGGTNYGTALNEALNFDIYPEQVLFLSDGLPNQNNYLDEVATLGSLGIVVDTIGIGNPNSQAPLQNIANLTGGSYTFISAPGSGGKLLKPVFSVVSASLDYTSFPVVLTLANPNASTDPNSFIRYSINGGPMSNYEGALSLPYNTTVTARVESNDVNWAPSEDESQTYSVADYPLAKPLMTLSATEFKNTGNKITVTLTNPNPSEISTMVYWLEGQDEESDAIPYTEPFEIRMEVVDGEKRAPMPVARAVGTQSFVIDSPATSQAVTYEISEKELIDNALALINGDEFDAAQLDPVKFSPEGNHFDYTKFPLSLTLTNPNPATSGSFIMVSVNGADPVPYLSPLSLDYDSEVSAFVETGTLTWSRSQTRSMDYHVKPVQLSKPKIELSKDKFNSGTKEITMTITNPNDGSISNVIYWFEGQDESTDAITYTGPVTLTADAWEAYSPKGGDEVEIFARAVGTENFVKSSSVEDKDLENDL